MSAPYDGAGTESQFKTMVCKHLQCTFQMTTCANKWENYVSIVKGWKVLKKVQNIFIWGYIVVMAKCVTEPRVSGVLMC